MKTTKQEKREEEVDLPMLHIDQAPYRIRREYYRRERRNSAIAVLVIALVVSLLAWGGYRLVRWLIHA